MPPAGRQLQIVPHTVCGLVLPSAAVIADVGQGGTVCCLVITGFIGLLITCIQPHSLPVIDRYSAVKEGVGRIGGKVGKGNALIGDHPICGGGNLLVLIGGCLASIVDLVVGNPVFQVDGGICQGIIGGFSVTWILYFTPPMVTEVSPTDPPVKVMVLEAGTASVSDLV